MATSGLKIRLLGIFLGVGVAVFSALPSVIAQTFGAPPAPGVSKAGVRATLSEPNSVDRPPPKSFIVVRVFLRLLFVGLSFLKMDDMLVNRLKKKKPINLQQVQARVFSGKRQMRMLYSRALRLESRMDASDPKHPQISGIKLQLHSLGAEHKLKTDEIDSLSGGNRALVETVATAAEFFEPPVDTATEAYPVKSLNEQF